MIIEWTLNSLGGEMWTGFIWLRIGIGDEIFWIRKWSFVLQKGWGISWLAERLSACR
jgi:hypothetical protein